MNLGKLENFVQPVENTSQKMTKTRLVQLLGELNLQYSLQGEGNTFDIIIDCPPEHVAEKGKLERATILNKAIETRFDEEHFLPLFRAIKYSTNFDCKIVVDGDKSKYIVSVFKK